ncbi:MAG: peptidase C13, partial [Bradyrhizobium sp.]|nr:peptidase C13 [Bradyrhizobium sp.]
MHQRPSPVAALITAALILAPLASASAQPADDQRLSHALTSLQPQRTGTVDAYVVVIALDSDPVFSREAREAGRVLASRFDAAGRTIVLANEEGASKTDGRGSPQTLATALRRAAELMDRNEDVLILYSTSHGAPDAGLVYKNEQGASGLVSPGQLAEKLRSLGIRNRLLILQACFAGQFIPALKDAHTIIVTAAASDRTSFGCQAGNDWTFFGDALINHALRQPLPFDVQVRRAMALIGAAE